jgi:hypothetical protein
VTSKTGRADSPPRSDSALRSRAKNVAVAVPMAIADSRASFAQ